MSNRFILKVKTTSESTLWFLLVSVVLLLAVFIRIPELGGSFWLDEAAQAQESTRPIWQQFAIAPDFQPPTFHLFVHALQYVSHSEWWLRMASLLPGVVSIWLLMEVVKKWWTPKSALVVGMLMAVSNIHIFFSQELRPYMWGVFWAMMSLYSWSHWWFASKNKKIFWLRSMSVINAVGALASYVFIFWWIGQFLVTLLFHPRRWKSIIGSFGISTIGFLIWWPWFLEQWRVGQTLRAALPGWSAVVSIPFLKAVPLTLAKFITGVIEIDFTLLYGVLVGGWWMVFAIGILQLVWNFYSNWQSGKRDIPKWFPFFLLLSISFFFAWIFTMLTPVLAPKRILYLLPIFFILVAAIAREQKKIGTLLIIWFWCWQIYANTMYWTNTSLQRENWRSLTYEIESTFSPTNTALVFGFDGSFAPWQWYESESWHIFATGTTPPETIVAVEKRLSGLIEYEQVLVFDYLRDLTDPERKIEIVLTEWGYEEIGALTYPNIGPVRIWTKQRLYAQEM